MMNTQFMNGQPQPGYGPGTQPGYGPGTQTGFGPNTQPGYGPGTQPGFGSGTQPGYGPPPPMGGHPAGSGPPNSMMLTPGQPSMMGPPGQGGTQVMKPGAHNGANPSGYGPPSTGMPGGPNIRGPGPGQYWSPDMQSSSDSISNQMNGLSVSGAGRGQPSMPGPTLGSGPPRPGLPPPVSAGPRPPSAMGPPAGQPSFPPSHGPPGTNQGLPPPSHGLGINQGLPPPGINQGPPPTRPPGVMGPPAATHGPPGINQGPPPTSLGSPAGNQPPSSSYGPPGVNHGPPPTSHGPPGVSQGITSASHGLPMMTHQGPQGLNHGPPPLGHPGSNQGPPTVNQGPPGVNQRPPSVNQGPPMMNQRPPGGQPQYPGGGSMPPAGPGGAPPMSGYAPPPGGYGPPPPAGYQSGGSLSGPRPGGPPSGGMYPAQMGPPPPRGATGLPPPASGVGGYNPAMSMNVGSDSPVPGGAMQPGYQPSGGVMGGGYPQPGGYPSQPGGPQAHRPMPGPMAGPAQPQQQRRLDPDHMPSPIQVMEDDRRNRGGLFQTGQRGIVPPLVTTSFITEDQGACSPRFLRSTMYNIPCTSDILKQSHIPFALTLVPFARLHPKENPPPIVDLGQMGPIRCNRCKAYMCPYMLFVDGGRKFQCSFCGCHTEVPPEYFAHLDHTGRRIDCYDRPELCLGAYEFAATVDYCKDGKLPNAPAYIFMIDVSYNSVKSGLVDLLCARLKDEVLSCLPKDVGEEESEIRVGFVTYAKDLHFYNIKETLAQPQMLVVSDVNDVFVPLLDGFFVKVSEAEQIIDSLLTQISQVFSDSRETETILGPVIQAGLDALQSAQRAGKLIIFHSSLPTAEAPGKLSNRDDRKLLGTDKEKTLLAASSNFYTKLAGECVAAGCSVDLYLFPNSYADVASVSEVSRLTGGSLHKYTYFQSDLDGDLLISDLITNISRPVAFDAVVRVRTSTGIRAVDFYGNFFMSNTTDVELACIDSDKSISVEIKHDDKLTEAEGAFVQAAILYTSVAGRRRLRVLNIALNCCTQIADLFRNCELDVLVNFMAKQSIRECLNSNSRQVRDNLMNTCSQILACYRKNCASPSSSGQLILPECMKLLPVYTNCVIKSGILQSVDINTDDRSYNMFLINAMSVTDSNVYFYPRLMPLHEVDVNSTALPTPIRCSSERLRDNGVYLLENGLVMFIWIGLSVNPEWVRDVFNVPSAAQIDIDKTRLQDIDNPLSKRIRQIVKRVRDERHRHMKLIIIRQRDKLEPVFQQYLVEDKGSSGSSSYVDFLCHIHKEIRNLLN